MLTCWQINVSGRSVREDNEELGQRHTSRFQCYRVRIRGDRQR